MLTINSVLILLQLLFIQSGQDDFVKTGESWPGWRGMHAQGVLDSLDQPLEHIIRWRIPIDGIGHSSPIIQDSSIYLTTAYPAKTSKFYKDFLSLAIFSAILLLIIFSVKFSFQNHLFQKQEQHIVSFWRLRLFAFWSILTLIVVLSFFGKEMIHYSEFGDTRSRLAVIINVIVPTILLSSYKPIIRNARLYLGLLIVLISLGLEAFLFEDYSIINSFNHAKQIPTNTAFISPFLISLSPVFIFGLGVHHILSYSFRKYSMLLVNLFGCFKKVLFSIPQAIRLLTGIVLILTIAYLSYANSIIFVYVIDRFNEYAKFEPALGWNSIYLFIASFSGSIIFYAKRIDRLTPANSQSTGSRFLTFMIIVLSFLNINSNLVNPVIMQRALVSLNENTGKLNWVYQGPKAKFSQQTPENSAATPTPFVNNDMVFAYFGTPGMIAVNSKGDLEWYNNDLPYENIYGVSVSPIIEQDHLILVADTKDDPFITAIDVKSGNEIWTRQRELSAEVYNSVNRTPVIFMNKNRPYILVWGYSTIKAYDLYTGIDYLNIELENLTANDKTVSLVTDSNSVYCAGFQFSMRFDIQDIEEEKYSIRWHHGQIKGSGIATPVLKNNLLFWVSRRGFASCLDAKTGEIYWQKRLGGTYYSSPIIAGDNVYFASLAGKITAVKLSNEFQIIAEMDLNERIYASMAVTQRGLFVRTQKSLINIK